MQQDGSREQERLSVKTTYDDSQTVWEEKTAVKVLRITSDGLLKDLNYLGFALNSFEYKPDRRLVTSATDGQYLYFSPTKQLELFKNNSVFLSRLYLHSVLHCLFSHLWLRGSRDERLWSAACDICVEYVIDKLDKPSVRRTITLVRQQVYEEFEKSGKAVSAAVVYRYLEGLDAKRIDVIAGEFFADDHVFWPKENKLSQKEIALMKKWQKAGDQVNKKRTSGEGDDDGEALAARQIQAGKTRKSYRAFLQEFMVMHEELQTDPDEFDIGYYMYGLSIYKNMPLIEPVETKETKRIEDFAVVIDTSYSTDGELVKSFLRETFGILKSRDSFFRKGKFDSRSFIKYAGLEILFVVLFSGWWFVRCYFVLDGDILGLRSLSAAQQLAVERGESVKNIPAESMNMIQFLTQTTVLKDMTVSFVAMYGSMSLWAGDIYYVLYLLFMGAGALAGVTAGIRQLKKRSVEEKVLEAAGIAFALVTVGIWFVYCYFVDMQPQGRYVMPVVFVLMYYVVCGYKKIADMIKSESVKKYVPLIISAFVILMFLFYVYAEVYPLYIERPVWSDTGLPL